MGIVEGIIALVAAVAPLIASAISNAAAEGDYEEAARLSNQAIRDYNLDAPELSAADIAPQTIDKTAFSDLKEDPALRAMQLRALEQIQAEASGGPTAEDDLAFDAARGAAGRVDVGLRGAAAQRAAARGMGGSLASYLGDLQGAQAGANQAGDMSIQAAADMRRRQQAALGALLRGSGDVRGQDYGVASRRAAEEDALNRFNAKMRFDADQQSFLNRMAMVQGRNQARGVEGQRLERQGQRKRQQGAATGEAIASGATAVGDAYAAGQEREGRRRRREYDYDDYEEYY